MATIPAHGFIFVFGLSLTVVVSYGDNGGVTSATTSSTSECDDLYEVCLHKIDVFNNDTICRKLKDVVDCLTDLNGTCHQLQNSKGYYNYDYDYEDAAGEQGDSGFRNDTYYYDKASNIPSIPDLISNMQTEYQQKCPFPAKPSSQGSASTTTFRPAWVWMGLLCLLIHVMLTLIFALL